MKLLVVKYSTLFNIDRKYIYKLFYKIKKLYNCCNDICYTDYLYHKYNIENLDTYMIRKIIKRLYICDINKLNCNENA